MSKSVTNPEVGLRCGACRLGLNTHQPTDPQCALFMPPELEETASFAGAFNLEQLADNTTVLARYDIADSTISDNGRDILWADLEDPSNPYTIASSHYGDPAGEPETAFLRNALPILQAAPALIAEVVRLRGALAAALHDGGKATVIEWGTAMKDNDGAIWDEWPHDGLNSGVIDVAELEAELVGDERPLVIISRQVETAWTEYHAVGGAR